MPPAVLPAPADTVIVPPALVPDPVDIVVGPPKDVAADVAPDTMVTAPPVPVLPEPTDIVIAPPAPVVAPPVLNAIEPLALPVDTPDAM